MSELEGTVQWICQSPFRPNHKRKNWFVGVSIIKEAPQRSQLQNRHEALNKLNVLLAEQEANGKAKQENDAWREHTKIVRETIRRFSLYG